jgi:hypothetical protein
MNRHPGIPGLQAGEDVNLPIAARAHGSGQPI